MVRIAATTTRVNSLSKKENKVFPAQVVEEVTRKTLEEEEISYVVKMPDKEGSKVPLDDLDVDIFKNEKEIKAFMIDNSTKTINRLVDWAEKVGSKMFQETVKSKQQKKKRKAAKKKKKLAMSQRNYI